MDRQQAIQAIFENFETLSKAASAKNSQQPHPGLPTRAQIGVMLVLRHAGPCSIKDIAAKFNMTSSAATQLANGLVKEGLAKRKEDCRDRRKTSLEMTPKGQLILAKVKKVRTQKFNGILSILTDIELAQLEKIQRKLVGHLQKLWIKNLNKHQ